MRQCLRKQYARLIRIRSPSPGTLEAAERAVGAAVLGVDLLIKGDAKVVFCANPTPRASCRARQGHGVLLFQLGRHRCQNMRLEVIGLERVAIVDFDVHHGNGTEMAVRGDNRILFCSLFQHPFYPHSGDSPPTPFYRPVPIAATVSMVKVQDLLRDAWFNRLREFAPDLVIFSAGFDAHLLDDMSDLRFQENDFAWLTKSIRTETQTSTNGRFLSVLEGGYEPSACARSVVSHLKALLD